MSGNEDLFKTQVVGGYDKEEVSKEIEKMQEDMNMDKKEWTEIIAEKDNALTEKEMRIAELKKKLEEKSAENDALRKDIREKYQSYIDNYESIGSLIYDSKIRSEQMVAEAEERRNSIIADAEQQAQQRIEAVQAEIDKRIDDGEQRYKAVEEELEGIVNLMNQVQRRFMESYKAIHNIVRDMPGLGGLDED